jgi:hypothetical protein
MFEVSAPSPQDALVGGKPGLSFYAKDTRWENCGCKFMGNQNTEAP